jgi:hypothetical protein
LEEFLKDKTPEEHKFLWSHMYGGRNGKLIYLANDDSIYCNHSKDGYNIDFADDLGETEIAIRDI